METLVQIKKGNSGPLQNDALFILKWTTALVQRIWAKNISHHVFEEAQLMDAWRRMVEKVGKGTLTLLFVHKWTVVIQGHRKVDWQAPCSPFGGRLGVEVDHPQWVNSIRIEKPIVLCIHTKSSRFSLEFPGPALRQFCFKVWRFMSSFFIQH